jgi:hypothetical protein
MKWQVASLRAFSGKIQKFCLHLRSRPLFPCALKRSRIGLQDSAVKTLKGIAGKADCR